jgi:anti-anti-sigma factor
LVQLVDHGDDVAATGARVGRDGNQTVLWLWGEQDTSTEVVVRTALVEAIHGTDLDVVVDLGDVSFINVAIIHALVRGSRLLTARHRYLTVRSPQRCPRRLFEVCNLTEWIEPAPTDGRNRNFAWD